MVMKRVTGIYGATKNIGFSKYNRHTVTISEEIFQQRGRRGEGHRGGNFCN